MQYNDLGQFNISKITDEKKVKFVDVHLSRLSKIKELFLAYGLSPSPKRAHTIVRISLTGCL